MSKLLCSSFFSNFSEYDFKLHYSQYTPINYSKAFIYLTILFKGTIIFGIVLTNQYGNKNLQSTSLSESRTSGKKLRYYYFLYLIIRLYMLTLNDVL